MDYSRQTADRADRADMSQASCLVGGQKVSKRNGGKRRTKGGGPDGRREGGFNATTCCLSVHQFRLDWQQMGMSGTRVRTQMNGSKRKGAVSDPG